MCWVGENIEKTTKINYRYDDVNKVLDKINSCIVDKYNANKYVLCTHEILLKKKVSLHRYLIAVSDADDLTPEILDYLKFNYPDVKVLTELPESADELNKIIEK